MREKQFLFLFSFFACYLFIAAMAVAVLMGMFRGLPAAGRAQAGIRASDQNLWDKSYRSSRTVLIAARDILDVINYNRSEN